MGMELNEQGRVVGATDGSSLGNPGPGAWAWAIAKSDSRTVDSWASGALGTATNNQAELTALLELLRTVPPGHSLEVRADSQYTINCVTKWMKGWKARGWRKADGGPVSNVDLLRQLDDALTGRDVTFVWVKAHQARSVGDPLNRFVDEKAQQAARTQTGAAFSA